ncbi:hypothetical protein F4827_007142 [Paraburkholderia bannensis]|uniref:Uncharacterized protein n=1 Tax=Paraburkholderia bannensis TaxID=765414 RepID=A0A7W9U5C3_9BURK|nr:MULTISPECIES: hypothetical protein [Paraburkholderia]MBB3262397.1 hypothetical protein [Paraburkholderia sp. WP4_3_2]MBB6107259.1 hypothetical protein [Paraburkholderia bannensis]
MTFIDGTTLELNGRRIMKCVISLADYGGLHDGAVVRNTLTTFSQIHLNPARELNSKQQDGLDSANEQLDTLQKHCSEFAALMPSEKPTDLFDNFLFHNVFFVEHLLLSAQTSESLLTSLLRGHRIVTGSRDPFFDHAQFQAARN